MDYRLAVVAKPLIPNQPESFPFYRFCCTVALALQTPRNRARSAHPAAPAAARSDVTEVMSPEGKAVAPTDPRHPRRVKE